MRRMFRTEPIDLRICPTTHPRIRGLPGIWELIAPALYEEGSCIQVDRKYIVSIGAHFTHGYALLSKKYTIGYCTAIEVCNYLSFLFDTAIDVGIGMNEREAKRAFRGLSRYFRLRGVPISDYRDVQHAFSESRGIVASVEDNWLRVFPVSPDDNGRFLAFDLPTDAHLKNALVAYRQALFCVEPVGQILNYWRVVEATTSVAERAALFANVFHSRLQGVAARRWIPAERIQFANLVSRYKSFLRMHYTRLLARHGSDEAMAYFFFKHRRNPSAHAKSDVLQIDHGTSIHDLVYDALLLKLVARFAVQRYYDAHTV